MTWTHQKENETRGVREDLKDCFEEWRGIRRNDSLKEKKKYYNYSAWASHTQPPHTKHNKKKLYDRLGIRDILVRIIFFSYNLPAGKLSSFLKI